MPIKKKTPKRSRKTAIAKPKALTKTGTKKGATRKKSRKVIQELTPEMRARVQEQHRWPWKLRPYQKKAQQAFEQGKRRQGLFWHRRAGKDVFCLSIARNESRQRVGGYVHFFPKHIQAKRALWNGIDPKKSANFIDIAFGDQESHRNNTEMMVQMVNGSTWQLLGSDNYDRIVGGNIVGAFFSEWALCDPRAWDFIRPMILENNGFAFFITTFRGRNHAWQMAQNLKNNPDWHIDIMNVEQSRDADGNRIITDEMIDSERKSGMSEALIQQEYYCNPEATADGAIYGNQVEHLRHEPRRNLADWNPSRPVYCVWNFDLPVFAAFLMIQPGDRPLVLDAGILEFTSLGDALAHVNHRRWPIQHHCVMAVQRELTSELSSLSVRPLVMPTRNSLTVTTCAASFIERMYIDGEECDLLLDALSGYVRQERFDPQAATLQFGPDPVMSWHGRLAQPLESFAAWDYASGDAWGPRPNYAEQDKAAKILL